MSTNLREGPVAWDIYAEQLFYHGYGYPLWLPDPDPSASTVQMGDVCWLKEGGVRQLFNTRSAEDEQPVPYGVPKDFVKFDPPNVIISGPQENLGSSPIYGRTVEQYDISAGAEGGGPLPVPIASGGASFGFKCKADSGAMLLFHPTAFSREIESKRHIVNYMRDHFANWFDFAAEYGLSLKEEEILFVSGTTHTSKWAVAAFCGQLKKKSGSITADLSSIAGLNLSVSISNERLPQRYYASGPRRRSDSSAASTITLSGDSPALRPVEENVDQCIFIHYYKMKRRIWSARPMRAAAGPHELPPPGPDGMDSPVTACEEDAMSAEGFERIPSLNKPFDPVNDLLDYILETSEADVAVASDLDVYALFRDQEFPHDFADALQSLQPTIDVDQHGVGTVSVILARTKPRVEDEPAENVTMVQGTIASAEHSEMPRTDGFADPTRDSNLPDLVIDLEDAGIGGAGTHGGGYDERSMERRPKLGAPTSVHDGSVTALVYSLNGKYVASGSADTTIIVWDVHANHALHKLTGHVDNVTSLTFSRDNRFLASGSTDEHIVIWRVEGGREVVRLSPGVPIHALRYSPDGSMLIAGAYDGFLRIWNAKTYEPLYRIPKHVAVITFIIFSPDGRLMATGGTESDCYIWELATLERGEPKSVLQGHMGMVCAAAFSSDGRRIVTASDDGSSRVWNTETGEALVILREHAGPVWTVAFSPDNKHVASGSSDSTVKVCDSYSGDMLLSLDGHDGMINAVVFSSGGQFIASAASDNTVRLWRASDGSCVQTYNEHDDSVTTVLFSPEATTVASGSHDGVVHIRSIVGV